MRHILRQYIPASWFHPLGIRKVLRRLEPLLPDVQGKLFLTFTFARDTCNGNPAAAFEHGRDKLRRLFHKLRRGVQWQGKSYRIDAPYCVKVEFHEDGWAHFHVIFLTRRFLPGPLLNELWGLGRCNVQRIDNDSFRYLLKYVCKGGDLPDWIKARPRLRVFQSSRGFLKKPSTSHAQNAPKEALPSPRNASARNIGERLKRWERMGLLAAGESGDKAARYRAVLLRESFQPLLGQLVLPVARDGRYLGNGQVLINDPNDLLIWI